MADWYVRPYMPGDEEHLVALFSRVFGRPRTSKQWRWKLKERPADFETVFVAATPSGEIVGQYGGIPLQLQLRGQLYPVVHAVEAMTAPEYRRQGMLTRLGSAAHEAWREAGLVAVLGLPNEQWGTRNRALGYKHLFPLVWLRFPLRLERLVSQQGRLPDRVARPTRLLAGAASLLWRRTWRARASYRARDIEIAPVNGPCRELDRLWSLLSARYSNLIAKDAAWVEWRYLRAVDLDYKVVLASTGSRPRGYIAYRLTGRGVKGGYIADLFTAPGDSNAAAALLSAALDDLSKRGAASALASAPPGSPLYRLLRRSGFLWSGAEFSFELVPLDPQLDLDALSDATAWHLTTGDFDIDMA